MAITAACVVFLVQALNSPKTSESSLASELVNGQPSTMAAQLEGGNGSGQDPLGASADLSKVPPAVSLGDEMLSESETVDSPKVQFPKLTVEELGGTPEISRSGSADGESFKLVIRAPSAVVVQERRKDRYRAVCLVRRAAQTPGTEASPQFDLKAIVPRLNESRTNGTWMFAFLPFGTQVIDESGNSITHPDQAAFQTFLASAQSGEVTAEKLFDLLRSHRFPASRQAAVLAAAQSDRMTSSGQTALLRALGNTATWALLCNANVGPDGSYELLADDSAEEAIEVISKRVSSASDAELVLDAVAAAMRTELLLPQLLRKYAGRSEVDEPDKFSERDEIPTQLSKAVDNVWSHASSDAIVKLLRSIDGANRSVQLRRLLSDRTLTDAQRDSLQTVDSASSDFAIPGGGGSIDKVLNRAADNKLEYFQALSELLNNPALTKEDADKIATASLKLGDDPYCSMLLQELEGKASWEHLAVVNLKSGYGGTSVQRFLTRIPPTEDKQRIRTAVANSLPQANAHPSVIEEFCLEGDVENIVQAVEKMKPEERRDHLYSKIKQRPDLLPAHQSRLSALSWQ